MKPDRAAVRAYYAKVEFPIRLTARLLDGIVRQELPEVRAGIKWAVPFYFLRGPICYVSCARAHVTFGLAQGTSIPDHSGLLRSTGRSPIAKAIFRRPEDVPEATVCGWLRAARRADAAWKGD